MNSRKQRLFDLRGRVLANKPVTRQELAEGVSLLREGRKHAAEAAAAKKSKAKKAPAQILRLEDL